MASCANCGAKLPKASRYCPQCGHASEAGSTKVMDVPRDESPRFYGVVPATSVLVLAVAAVAGAAVVFALGAWPFGLILLGIGVLFVVIFAEAERRHPSSAVARSSADALGSARARAGFAADALATRGRTAGKLLAARKQIRRMNVDRQRMLLELGQAVYRGDEQAADVARERLGELDQVARQKEAEIQAVVARAQERINRHRLEVQPTEMVEPPDGEGEKRRR